MTRVFIHQESDRWRGYVRRDAPDETCQTARTYERASDARGAAIRLGVFLKWLMPEQGTDLIV